MNAGFPFAFLPLRLPGRGATRTTEPATWRRVLTGLAILGIALGAASPAHAQMIMPNIPDYYQHQFWPGPGVPAPTRAGWEGDGGWCRWTAITDALDHWDNVAAYNKLYSNNAADATTAGINAAGTWLNASGNAIQNFHDNRNAAGLGEINNYLNLRGVGLNAAFAGQPGLLSMWYRVDPATGNVFVNLANHRVELVTRNGVAYNAFSFYTDQLGDGRSTVLTLKNTAQGQNGLWWAGPLANAGSYHAVAGAGIDAANRRILFADPDSNKGNLPANAGWTAGQVTANKYTAADGAAGPPLPGNLKGAGGAYTNADLYGTIQMNANGNMVTASDAAGGINATGRYVGVRLSDIETVAPIVSQVSNVVQLGVNKFRATFHVIGDVAARADAIELFPAQALADNAFSFGLPNWTETPVFTDPFGGARAGGGEDIVAGSGTLFDPGANGDTTLDTTAPFTGFDVYMHDSTTGQWLVESVGADSNALGNQLLVPDSPSGLLMGSGLAGFVGVAVVRRRRNGSRVRV